MSSLYQEYEKRGILSGVSNETLAEWRKDWQQLSGLTMSGLTSPAGELETNREWDAEYLEDIKNCPF